MRRCSLFVLLAGYKLDVDEVEQLLDHVDTAHTGVVAKSQLAASQIDWEAMQQSNAERWLASARKVFQDFDTDQDGIISSEQIVDCLRSKLPPSEVSLLQCCWTGLCTCCSALTSYTMWFLHLCSQHCQLISFHGGCNLQNFPLPVGASRT